MRAAVRIIVQLGKDALGHPPYRVEVDTRREGHEPVQMRSRRKQFLFWRSPKRLPRVIASLAQCSPANFVETKGLVEIVALVVTLSSETLDVITDDAV